MALRVAYLCLWLAACTSSPAIDTDTDTDTDLSWTALITETAASRIRFHDLELDEPLGEINVSDLLVDTCLDGPHPEGQNCQPFWLSHRVVDGNDELTLAFGRIWRSYVRGGLARIRPSQPPEVLWVVERLEVPTDLYDGVCNDSSTLDLRCHLSAPHRAAPTPDGDQLVVADTINDRVVFLAEDDEGRPARLVAVLDADHPDFQNTWIWPNHLEVFEDSDRTWMLLGFKGRTFGDEELNTSTITLWDITNPADAHLQWRYPEGHHALAALHSLRVVSTSEGPLLVYAHSRGASDGVMEGELGSVGFARFSLDTPPVYLGDGILDESSPLGFVRTVRQGTAPDQLLIVDSGCEKPADACGKEGRLLEVRLTVPTGADVTGGFDPSHAQQHFFEMERVGQDLAAPLRIPYMAVPLPLGELGAQLQDMDL